jgi:hypothetical protein
MKPDYNNEGEDRYFEGHNKEESETWNINKGMNLLKKRAWGVTV